MENMQKIVIKVVSGLKSGLELQAIKSPSNLNAVLKVVTVDVASGREFAGVCFDSIDSALDYFNHLMKTIEFN